MANRCIQGLKTKLNIRYQSTVANQVSTTFTNRNPRNLERIRIGYKPDGYHVEKPGNKYWHKLELKTTGRYVIATVKHFENGEVLKVSSAEWGLSKQLYRTKDTAAFINVGRVLADRCLKSGLNEISCFIEPTNPNGKIAAFLQAVKDGGITLQEPPQYKKPNPWDNERPEKPWEVTE